MSEPDALKALQSEAHVWIAYPDSAPAQHLIEQYLPLLNSEEQERYRRFHFDHDRHTYLAAHALLRITLSRYALCEPARWGFKRNEQGKPEIALMSNLPPLRMNLSHTQGMVACVVALDRGCGVDVERVRSMKDMAGIAEVVFSNAENDYLRAQDETEWPHHFFKFWTLKEAYIKATGQGLSAPLKDITFDIAEAQIQTTLRNASLNDAGWQFYHEKPVASHHLAVAVKSADAPIKILCREMQLNQTLESHLSRSCSDFKIPGS